MVIIGILIDWSDADLSSNCISNPVIFHIASFLFSWALQNPLFSVCKDQHSVHNCYSWPLLILYLPLIIEDLPISKDLFLK